MARKRMIDPHFWESAQDKGWTSDDCTLMMAAISMADDEGRGRLKSLNDAVSGIISTRKLKKSFSVLQDSIKTYAKIYYFLPNWDEYQKVSHPVKSKYPDPKLLNNNKITPNSSGINHELLTKDSITSEVSLNKYSLNKVKVKDPTFLKFSSSLKKLFEDHTKIKDPNKSTHLNPILQFYEKIPEVMTEVDISNCIESAFKSLDPGKGVRIDFLCDGIQQRITAEHERILTESKQAEHEEARKDRAKQNKADSKKAATELKEQRENCIEFWEKNRKKFKTEENLEIKRHVIAGNLHAALKVIQPKMDEFELI